MLVLTKTRIEHHVKITKNKYFSCFQKAKWLIQSLAEHGCGGRVGGVCQTRQAQERVLQLSIAIMVY